MAWNGLVLTNDGQIALTKAQIDGQMHIKSIVVGDGDVPQNFRTQKSLVHKLYEITDIKIIQNDEGCMVIGDFPLVGYDYYFRELGVIVATNEGEKLYVYDNCGNDATHIVVSTGMEHRESRIRIKLIFSDVAEVKTTIESVLYVDYQTFEKEFEKLRALAFKDKVGDDYITDVAAEKVTQDSTHRMVTDMDRAKWNAVSNKVDKVTGIKAAYLPTSGWSSTAPYTQTVHVAGMTAEDSPIIGLRIAEGTAAANVKLQNKAWGCLDRAVTGAGTVTFYCYNKKPDADFNVTIKGV